MAIRRLFDFLDYQLEYHPQPICLATKKDSGWEKFSTQDVKNVTEDVACGLLKMGVQPGDKVAIASTTNRAEWNFIDLACLMIGAIDVPVYPTISEKDYKFIFSQSEVKLCFVSDKPLYDKMVSIKNEVPTLEDVFIFDDELGCKNWRDVREMGKGEDRTRLEELKANVKYEDLATIIYTSGTTGEPKGVMQNHRNVLHFTVIIKRL